MKKCNYEQPKLWLLTLYKEDVITASALDLGDNDFGQEDIFNDY